MANPIETGRLYDFTGTLLPLPGPPKPPDASLVPDGVQRTVYDRYRNYPSKDLTPSRIEQIFEAADIGEPFDLIQLLEEMAEKDPKISSVLHTRTAAVLGLVHEVRPVKLDDEHSDDQSLADEIAAFCDGALDCAGLDDLNGDLLDSVYKTIAVDWIDWGTDDSGKVVPQTFQRIPPTHLRWGTYSDSIRVWDPTGFTMTGGDIGTVFEPYTTVRALNNERRDSPTRAGLGRTMAWYYLFKNTSIKDWVTLADRFGLPQRILSLDPNDFTNPELYEKARQALKSIGSSASGVISKDWILNITSAAAQGGAALFKAIIEYIDTAIAQLVLGHELSSQGSKGGGQLGISAANQVRQDILEGDCTFLASVIRRDLLTPMVGWNYGWDKLYLTPTLEFDNEPARDLVAEANVTSTIFRTFPTLVGSKQQLRDRFGIDGPLDDGSDESTADADTDAITAGSGASAGGGAETPITTPYPQPGTPDISVNSTATARLSPTAARRRRSLPRQTSPTARQKIVDRLTAKAVTLATAETAKLKTQLRAMIREGNAEGLSIGEMAHRISKAYPDLDVDRLDSLLKESQILVRLFGRNA